jgi:hypothetical protein
MARRTRPFRLLALTLVVLQLALRAGAGVAEARLSASSGPWENYVHFEATGSAHIPPVHDVECGLCIYLSAGLTRPPALALELPIVARVAPVELRTLGSAHAGLAALPPARAPPAA